MTRSQTVKAADALEKWLKRFPNQGVRLNDLSMFSGGGCLGPGTYVAHADKASRFAANCTRHDGDSGSVLKVRVSFQRAKYASNHDHSWLTHEACRAEHTSVSSLSEWCLKHARQIEVLEIRRIACGDTLPAFEDDAMSLSVVRR